MRVTRDGEPDVDLTKPNALYVFRDGGFTDARAQEFEGRRYVWLDALSACTNMLHASIRARKSAIAVGQMGYQGDEGYAAWRKAQPDYAPNEPHDYEARRAYRLERADDFPTVIERFVVADATAQMGAITFLTVFNAGYGDPGKVAGNSLKEVTEFRERCVAVAVPNATDRVAFDALLDRIKAVRDGLLAHADGKARDADHQQTLTTLKSAYNAIAPEDALALYDYARRLLDAVRTTDLR